MVEDEREVTKEVAKKLVSQVTYGSEATDNCTTPEETEVCWRRLCEELEVSV